MFYLHFFHNTKGKTYSTKSEKQKKEPIINITCGSRKRMSEESRKHDT